MLQINPHDVRRDRIQAYYAAKNYVFFDGGDFDLNIVGIRSRLPQVNTFNDAILCFWRELGEWKQAIWAATTDPGLYWLKNPMVDAGTAVLMPNQYRGSHTIGTHKNYTALVQCGNLTVWRDGNRNDVIDFDKSKTYSGVDFGINIHHASYTGTSETVEGWSAGCQVFANIQDFNAFMALVFKSATIWGQVFSYTLCDQGDIERVVPQA